MNYDLDAPDFVATFWDVWHDPDFDRDLFHLDVELTGFPPPAPEPFPFPFPKIMQGVKLA